MKRVNLPNKINCCQIVSLEAYAAVQLKLPLFRGISWCQKKMGCWRVWTTQCSYSKVDRSQKMGTIRCVETLGFYYLLAQHHIPEEKYPCCQVVSSQFSAQIQCLFLISPKLPADLAHPTFFHLIYLRLADKQNIWRFSLCNFFFSLSAISSFSNLNVLSALSLTYIQYMYPQLTVIDPVTLLYVCFWRDNPPVGQGFLIHEVSRSHTTTHQSLQDSSGRVISSSQIQLIQ